MGIIANDMEHVGFGPLLVDLLTRAFVAVFVKNQHSGS